MDDTTGSAPSMEGLREAVQQRLFDLASEFPRHGGQPRAAVVALEATADYLRTHDVLYGPEGLVRVTYRCRCGPHPDTRPGWCAKGCGRDYNEITAVLVPVPSEAGEGS